MSKWISGLLSVALSLLVFPAVAFACPDDQNESCALGICVCVPQIGGDVGRAAEHLKKETQAQVVGLPLEQWFNASRGASINGAAPIPWQIRQALDGFSDRDAMDRVRYRIQDDGAFNLAHIIEQWRLYDVTAVTLIDVVVFRGPSEANEPCIWAHELTHVAQFRDWGVHSFAISYARDPNSAENDAYAKERDCHVWITNHQPRFLPPQQFPPRFVQPALGAFCYTPYGRFGPGPNQPLGAACYVPTPNGPIWGQVGN